MKKDELDYSSASIEYNDAEDAWYIWVDIFDADDEYCIATFNYIDDAGAFLAMITEGQHEL